MPFKQGILFINALALTAIISGCADHTTNVAAPAPTLRDSLYIPPDTATLPHDEQGDMIRYGRELIVNTVKYIGPEGTAGRHLHNKMNCGNCHVDGGTRAFALNYFSTGARYPQFRGRENRVLSLAERINNCIERPHNGDTMLHGAKEMKAMIAYIEWLGKDVAKGQRVKGDEASDLDYPATVADINNGTAVYVQHCASCHGADGQGIFNSDSSTYTYPPLWGQYAYERGSSMHRVLKMARFVKANMPKDKATWDKPLLTDKEAIDVAAFINDDRIHHRPDKRRRMVDYPASGVKPVDYDEGPYADTFSTVQHKFGPYQPIVDYHKAKNLPVVF